MNNRIRHIGGYSEIKPSNYDASWLDSTWVHITPWAVNLEPCVFHDVLPDNNVNICYVRKIDRFGDIIDKKIMYFGPIISPCPMPLENGVEMASVRMHPEFSIAIFGVAPKEHLNKDLELNTLCPKKANSILQLLDKVNNIYDCERLLLNWCRNEIEKTVPTIETRSLVENAVHLIRTSYGTLPISILSKRLEISQRHLQRQFNNEIGISPKRFAGSIRFNKVLLTLDLDLPLSGATIAQDYGYHDQAHMITEFRKFACVAPRKISQIRKDQSDLYNTAK